MEQEADIERKYKKHPDFKKQMDEIENFYNAELNLALYQNLQKLEEKRIFQSIEQNNTLTILFYGYKIQSEDDVQKLYRLYIRTYDEILRKSIKKYNIIFFNTLCTSNDPFSSFKSIYRTLPRIYYSKLDKIYLIHSTWTVNILDWIVIGRLPKLFSRRLQYIKNIDDLRKQKLPQNLMSRLPQEITNYANFKQQNGKNNKDKQSQIKSPKKRKSPFEFLAIKVEKYEMSDQKIPKILKQLLFAFKKNPSLLEREGIFRKSGNIEEEQNLIIQLARKNQKILDAADDGFVIAGLIKKFFTHLAEPILPYEFYQKVMSSTGISAEKEVAFAKQLLDTLPQLNYRIILYMISFLRQNVIKRQSITKMTEYNCGVVFAPCFSRPRNPDFADLIGTGKMVKFLTILFTRFQQIFGCKSQKWDICRKSIQKCKQQNQEENRGSTDSPKRSSNEEGTKVALNQKQLNT